MAAALRRVLDRRRRARAGGVKAHRVPARWLRAPVLGAGDCVCLFVALSRAGRLLPHSLDHAVAWHQAGFKIVIVVVADTLDGPIDLTSLSWAHGIMLRVNRGYDFGAWAAAIRGLGTAIDRLAVLALANDSVLGPSASFADMVARAVASDADLIGLIESRQFRPHFQSFGLFFKTPALRSRIFRRFWRGVRTGGRDYVIEHYELMLLALFEAAGLRAEALFRLPDDTATNPTLSRWNDLIDIGFPYLKVELIRDNPAGVSLRDWQAKAATAGFDIPMLDRQVAALRDVNPEAWLTKPHRSPTQADVAHGGEG